MERYPLQWPTGYKRYSYHRQDSKFSQTMEKAQRFLRDEIEPSEQNLPIPVLVGDFRDT